MITKAPLASMILTSLILLTSPRASLSQTSQPVKPPLANALNLTLSDIALPPTEVAPEAAIFQPPRQEEPAPFVGDPNETSSDLVFRYRRARRLIARGEWNRARRVIENALGAYPDSRNLHRLRAELLWYMSGGTNTELLNEAARSATRAARIGLGFGNMDYTLNRRISEILGRTGDTEAFESIYSELLARDASAAVYLDYARGLRLMGGGGTEEAFKTAVDLDGAEGDALAEYSEWLLDQKRDADVLSRLPKNARLRYVSFLRGVALERTGLLQEARAEYLRFAEFSRYFPAPARYRIPGSTLQVETGIHFDDEAEGLRSSSRDGIDLITAAITDTQARTGLSFLIYREATAESVGGKRAAGWIVRNRVLRGSVGTSPCPYVVNSGATLADQYKSVMCQGSGSQFNGVCLAWCSDPTTTSACTRTAESDNAAYDVYEGTGPDPVADHCPAGIITFGTGPCDAARTCRGNRYTYQFDGSLFNYGTSSSCPALCAALVGKVCANTDATGRDNCFYINTYCPGTSYSNTLTQTGHYRVTDPKYSAAGTHFGHLDGPDSQDFDLILETASSSAGPWSTYTSAANYGSTEEIRTNTGAGWFRWKVLSYSGSGNFTFCAKDP